MNHATTVSKKPAVKHCVFLFAMLAIYLVAYFAHPALPGNNPDYPMGWWGWFDQGEYLKAAKAIAARDFSTENYYYPPLYTLLGAAFVWVNPMHAFTILNTVCFLIFAHYFVLTAMRIVGWGLATFIFTFTVLFSQHILQIWVEPWTSSLVSALFAFLIAKVDEISREGATVSRTQLATWSIIGGAIFLTRPADAVTISPLFCFVLWQVWHANKNPKTPESSTAIAFQKTSALLVPGLLGVALFASFNFFVHGSIGGRYFAMAETNGFHLTDLLEKVISILLDAGTLYNVPQESILQKAKWLAALIPAAIFFLFKGNASIRLILTLILTQVIIYFPYADLLPTGVWKYHNIHYFKWIFPYAGLLIVAWAKAIPIRPPIQAGGGVWLASLALGIFFLSMQFKLDIVAQNDVKASLVEATDGPILLISAGKTLSVDKVSVPQLGGDFQAIYFSTNARVQAGDKELHYVRDYRFLPSKDGVDLLFIRPVKTDLIKIYPGDMRLSMVSTPPTWFSNRLVLGVPAWLR